MHIWATLVKKMSKKLSKIAQSGHTDHNSAQTRDKVRNRSSRIVHSYLPISVTIFGEIPPLWQNFKTLRKFFEGLVSVGQNFKPTLANLLYYLANFHLSI